MEFLIPNCNWTRRKILCNRANRNNRDNLNNFTKPGNNDNDEFDDCDSWKENTFPPWDNDITKSNGNEAIKSNINHVFA